MEVLTYSGLQYYNTKLQTAISNNYLPLTLTEDAIITYGDYLYQYADDGFYVRDDVSNDQVWVTPGSINIDGDGTYLRMNSTEFYSNSYALRNVIDSLKKTPKWAEFTAPNGLFVKADVKTNKTIEFTQLDPNDNSVGGAMVLADKLVLKNTGIQFIPALQSAELKSSNIEINTNGISVGGDVKIQYKNITLGNNSINWNNEVLNFELGEGVQFNNDVYIDEGYHIYMHTTDTDRYSNLNISAEQGLQSNINITPSVIFKAIDCYITDHYLIKDSELDNVVDVISIQPTLIPKVYNITLRFKCPTPLHWVYIYHDDNGTTSLNDSNALYKSRARQISGSDYFAYIQMTIDVTGLESNYDGPHVFTMKTKI